MLLQNEPKIYLDIGNICYTVPLNLNSGKPSNLYSAHCHLTEELSLEKSTKEITCESLLDMANLVSFWLTSTASFSCSGMLLIK